METPTPTAAHHRPPPPSTTLTIKTTPRPVCWTQQDSPTNPTGDLLLSPNLTAGFPLPLPRSTRSAHLVARSSSNPSFPPPCLWIEQAPSPPPPLPPFGLSRRSLPAGLGEAGVPRRDPSCASSSANCDRFPSLGFRSVWLQRLRSGMPSSLEHRDAMDAGRFLPCLGAMEQLRSSAFFFSVFLPPAMGHGERVAPTAGLKDMNPFLLPSSFLLPLSV
nr:uncharacterized protein LOC109755809 [Aegilops tauschii subsp. strangulata]